ncbi:MAG: sulfite exporter TauE/SafE family protein [Rhizobiaceae bacterium]
MIGALLPGQVPIEVASLLIVASFFTSALTAAAGIGGGLLMLALMTYVIPAGALIPVHGLVQLGSNSSRTIVQRKYIDWRITRIFLAGCLLGAAIGVVLVVQLPEGVLETALGLFIIFMAWIKLPALRNANASTIGMGGIVTTFISMFVGATGPLVAVFLINLFDQHRRLVATHAATMMAQHFIKIVAFGFAGFAFYQWLPLVVAMVISGFLGVSAGTMLMNRLPEKTLQILFKITLTLVSLDLLRRGLQTLAQA